MFLVCMRPVQGNMECITLLCFVPGIHSLQFGTGEWLSVKKAFVGAFYQFAIARRG